MKTFKLIPKPNSDYRAEVKEIKQIYKIEKFGYRYNKVVYGFSKKLDDIEEIKALGINIEEITYDIEQFHLTTYLEERGRLKSSLDRLCAERDENGSAKSEKESLTERQLKKLNDKIQQSKDDLEITGTVKKIRF